jgi:undecaprenyl-diphosphatase
MNWFQVIVMGIVEGLTEFLPVSSTGHMILASYWLHIPQTEFLKSFEVVVQLGAIAAVFSRYWQVFIKKNQLWKPLIYAFVPTMILGLLLYTVIKKVFLGNELLTLAGLLFGGIALILLEWWYKQKDRVQFSLNQIPPKSAIGIGLIQSLSMVPGVSRSAATIMGGMFLGLSRKEAVEFSFLLAVPVLAAATGLDLLKSGWSFTGNEWMQLLIGSLVAFVVARLTVNWLIRFVEKHSLAIFGWYRLVIVLIYYFSMIR